MIEIGGKPILWHIMKCYAHYGITEFVICLGYKGYLIKEYFSNLNLHSSDFTIDTSTGVKEFHQSAAEPWRVTLVDTGETTFTGGRLKRVEPFLRPDETFCMTYGDGLSDVDIGKLVKFHKSHGKLATVTAVVPPGRYGALEIEGDTVRRFIEKPPGDNGLINGGFFVLEKAVLNEISGDATPWEQAPLEALARKQQLKAYRHSEFWQAMDTLRDKNHLEELWASDRAPWKIWA